MKYLKLFAVFGALALVGAGSATLLEGFGTISGTASVEPALNITAVGNVSNEEEYVNLTSETSVSIPISSVTISDEAGSFDGLNSSETSVISPGQKVVVTDNSVSTSEVDSWFVADTLHLTTSDGTIGNGLNSDSDTVYVKIDGNTVDSLSYGG